MLRLRGGGGHKLIYINAITKEKKDTYIEYFRNGNDIYKGIAKCLKKTEKEFSVKYVVDGVMTKLTNDSKAVTFQKDTEFFYCILTDYKQIGFAC